MSRVERLTERDEYGNADIVALSDVTPEIYAGLSFSETNALTDALNRLAAYEDTGLEPEEVEEVYRRFCEARDIAVALGQEYADHVDELLEAEKQGRLIVLPCRVGDTVWEHDSAGRLYQYTVEVAYFTNGKVIFDADGISFDETAIRASVFLAREEAEAALGRSGSHGD